MKAQFPFYLYFEIELIRNRSPWVRKQFLSELESDLKRGIIAKTKWKSFRC